MIGFKLFGSGDIANKDTIRMLKIIYPGKRDLSFSSGNNKWRRCRSELQTQLIISLSGRYITYNIRIYSYVRCLIKALTSYNIYTYQF